ncbi:hypothetical protein EJV44_24800, partial [Ancylobacter aquaticus]
MSGVMLFLEIETLKNKVDRQMQMEIWPKFFPLLSNSNSTLNISLNEFMDFLETVARQSVLNADVNSTVLATGLAPAPEPTPPSAPQRRNLLNLFSQRQQTEKSDNLIEDLNEYRKRCVRLLQYYTLTSTTSVEFKISDLICCMIYLSRIPKYRPLYAYLEGTFLADDDVECSPYVTPDQQYNIVNLLRLLMEMPGSTIDMNTVKLLRSTMIKTMKYPLARFPRIMVLQNTNLTKDKRCTLHDLIIERSESIKNLDSNQCINDLNSSKIPYCDDTEFITDLFDMITDFPIPRMFYNAANSIFYSSMENYAVANCKFDVNDYNNIFTIMECTKESDALTLKHLEMSDSLNVYLGADKGAKRKK